MFLRFVFALMMGLCTLSAAPEKVSIQLDWKYQFEYAGYIAAVEKGFYREAGLDVELKEYREGVDVVSEVLNRNVPYGVYNSSIVVDRGRIRPIVIMATYLQHSPLVLVAKKGIENPADLMGKRVMGTQNEFKHSSLSLLLSHFGINGTNTKMIPHTFSIEPFVHGHVDVMSAYRSNQLYELDRNRIPYEIIDPIEYGFVMNAGNLFTSQQEAIENPDKALRLIEATNRGWAYALDHPDEIIDLLKKKYHVEKSHEALAYEAKVIDRLMMSDLYSIGETNSELTQRLFKQLVRAGIVREDQKLGHFLFRDIVSNAKNNFQLSNAEREYLATKQTIKMCVDPEWYPFEAIREGKHIGIAADVLQNFEKKLGIPIQLVPTRTWDETIQTMQRRECDILSLASPTPSRLKFLDFTDPYVTLPIVMATTMDKPFIGDIATLKKDKIGSVRGYAITEKLKAMYPELHVIEVENINDGLKMVENGELYGYVDNLMVISSYIQKEYTGVMKVSSRLDEKVELGVATRNDERHLHAIFQKLVMQLDDSLMQNIYNRWTSTIEQVAWIDKNKVLQGIGLLIIVIFLFSWHAYSLKRYNRKLLELSITDKLTGLYNRQKTDQRLMEEYHKLLRYSEYRCSLMMIDVDWFKHVNDSYGHQTGDRILIQIADLLKRTLRSTDIIGRWGGEEFIVILPHTTQEQALAAAENLRQSVEEFWFGLDFPITISIGVGEMSRSISVHESVGMIDGALYSAKNSGRNCVKSLA